MASVVDRISDLVDLQDVDGVDRILSTTPLTDEILLGILKLPAGDLKKMLSKHLNGSWAPMNLSTPMRLFSAVEFEVVEHIQKLNPNFNVTNMEELLVIIDKIRKDVEQGLLPRRGRFWKDYDLKFTEYFASLAPEEKTDFSKLRSLYRGLPFILPNLIEKIYLTSKLPISSEGFKELNRKYGFAMVTQFVLKKFPSKVYVSNPHIIKKGILNIPAEIQELLAPDHTVLSGGAVLAQLTNNFEPVENLQPTGPNHPFVSILPDYVRGAEEEDAVQDYDIYTDLPVEDVWKHFNSRGYRTASHTESDEKTVSYTGWLLRLVKYDETQPDRYVPKTKVDVIFTNRYLDRHRANYIPATPPDFIEKEFDLDVAKIWYDGSQTLAADPDVKRKIDNREFGLSFHPDMTINVHKTRTTAERIMKYVSRGFVFNQSPESTLARYILTYALKAFSADSNYEIVDPAEALEICLPYVISQLPQIKSYDDYFNRTTDDKFARGIPRPDNPPKAPEWWLVLRNAIEKFPRGAAFEEVFGKLGLNVYSFAYSKVLAQTIRLPNTFDDRGISNFVLNRILDVPDEQEFKNRVEIFLRRDIFNQRPDLFANNQDLKDKVDFVVNPPTIMKFFKDKYETFEIVGTRAALTPTEANKIAKYGIEPLAYLPKSLLIKAIDYYDNLPPEDRRQNFRDMFSGMLKTVAHQGLLDQASKLGLKEIIPLFEGWLEWRTENYRARARDYIVQIKADKSVFHTYLPKMKFPELYPNLFMEFFEDKLTLKDILKDPRYMKTDFFINQKSSLYDAVEKVFDCLRKMAEFATFIKANLSDQVTLDRIAKWEGWMCWEADSFDSIVDPPCMYFDQIKEIFETPLVIISQAEFDARFINQVRMPSNSASPSEIIRAEHVPTGEKVFLKTYDKRVSEGLNFESRVYQYITFMDSKLNGIIKDFIITSPTVPFSVGPYQQNTVTIDYNDNGNLRDFVRSDYSFVKNRFTEIMFDVLYINYLYNYRLKIKHNDAHFGNYRFKKLPAKRPFIYIIGNNKYIKEKDWEIRGYDFDHSSQFIDNFMIKENMFIEGKKFCRGTGSCNYYSQKDIHFIVASAYASLLWTSLWKEVSDICKIILNNDQVLENKIVKTATKKLNKNVFWSEFCEKIFDFNESKDCSFTYYPELDVDKVIDRFLTEYPPALLGMKKI